LIFFMPSPDGPPGAFYKTGHLKKTMENPKVPRKITFTICQCQLCPFSSGFYCKAVPIDEKGFKVIPKENRDSGIIPAWCPFLDD